MNIIESIGVIEQNRISEPNNIIDTLYINDNNNILNNTHNLNDIKSNDINNDTSSDISNLSDEYNKIINNISNSNNNGKSSGNSNDDDTLSDISNLSDEYNKIINNNSNNNNTKKNLKCGGKLWTILEEHELLQNIKKYTIKELAKKHGRTTRAIQLRINHIILNLYNEKYSLDKIYEITNIPIKNIENIINNTRNIKGSNVSYDKLYIYIIKCQHNKYYIGKSTDPNRIANHFLNNGSTWTQLHKPLEIVDIINNADAFDEDKYTKKYMAEYGIDNVRGGKYAQIILNPLTKKHLEEEINSVYDLCYKCGNADHFTKECNNTIHINGNKLTNKKKSVKQNAVNIIPNIQSKNDVCYKCGRRGHWAATCYAKKHIKGYFL